MVGVTLTKNSGPAYEVAGKVAANGRTWKILIPVEGHNRQWRIHPAHGTNGSSYFDLDPSSDLGQEIITKFQQVKVSNEYRL